MTITVSPASISYCQEQGEVKPTGMVDKSVEQRKLCAFIMLSCQKYENFHDGNEEYFSNCTGMILKSIFEYTVHYILCVCR